MKRTNVDFSKHELIIEKNDNVLIHHFKKPGTFFDSVKFINTSGILAVTGDYGNWIFCREFHPSKDGGVSDGYWIEKLRSASTQKPYDFDSDIAQKEIANLLESEDYNFTIEEREWLESLSDTAYDGEYAYIAEAMNRPNDFEAEMIPRGEKVNYWLEVIFDAFEEICKRLPPL
jgi:hypothetical protein